MTGMISVAVIDREPTEQEAKALAFDLLSGDDTEDPRVSVSWFTSQELPPIEHTGLPLHDYDQLEANLRDSPEGCYLIVMMDF